MILKASQRSGGKQLGLHLLKTEENEHVEIHEVRGFMSEDVLGAMREAHELSGGTKCRQYLFSLSLNPPESEDVSVETFEHALDAIEERLGLTGQPRVVVFHEKEGRRHAHAVWSRIDAETMTARPLSFFKTKLQDISRQLFLENGWKMPHGLIERGMADPKNFTLDEWQRAKRVGSNPHLTKELVQQCWSASDNRGAFERALEERGLYLARGDRRGRVIMTMAGEVHSLSRALGRKEKDLSAKLGSPETLPSIKNIQSYVGKTVTTRLAELIRVAKQNAAQSSEPLLVRRRDMAAKHRDERRKLDVGQGERWQREVKERSLRLRKGLAGLWDRMSGERAKAIARNEFEAVHALRRDRTQRNQLVRDQLRERQQLQEAIKTKRREGAMLVLALIQDSVRHRGRDGLERGRARSDFSRGAGQSRGSNPNRRNLSLDIS